MKCTLTFEWNPVDNIEGYRLYKSNYPGRYRLGEYMAIAHMPRGTEKLIYRCNLECGRWYYVITAYNRFGEESTVSDEVVICVKHPSAVVTAPEKLTVQFSQER